MKAASILFAVTFATAASAQEVPQTYEMHRLAEPGVVDQMAACVGVDADRAALVRFVEDRATSPKAEDEWMGAAGHGAILATRDQWACVQLTVKGYPLWPVETLKGAVVTPEASAEEVNVWRRSLLQQVAEGGTGWGLIVFPGGAAYRIDVSADAGHSLRAKYTQHFFKAGEIDVRTAPAVLAPKALRTVMFISPPGERGWFVIPQAALHPAVDGYVSLPGTPATTEARCASSQWAFTNKTVLSLQPDHVMKMTPASGAHISNGTWNVKDGVLHVAFDVVRFALTIDPETGRLSGIGRRPNNSPGDDADVQNRWNVTLTPISQ